MLYHYTSLPTLALILKTQSIKFNRLDLVDDPDESLFGYGDSDMKLNSSSFVSCWTEDSMENITLWKMYADFKGVRIGLDEDMFITHNIGKYSSFLDKDFYKEGYLLINASMNDTQPHYVEYNLKDDAHAIEFYRNCAVKHGPDILLHTNKIGVNKKEYWSFQREVRFVIRGMSVDENGCIIDEPVKRAEFYIQLKQDVLKKMEIVLGPKTGDGERSIAEALVYNTFQENHNIQIKNSIVKIR